MVLVKPARQAGGFHQGGEGSAKERKNPRYWPLTPSTC